MTKRDREKFFKRGPWTFDENIVMMSEIEEGSQPSEIVMIHCPFWVRLYNLSLDCRTKSHVEKIGGSIGDFLDVETDGVVWDKPARVKLLLDVTKPLHYVQKLYNSRGR